MDEETLNGCPQLGFSTRLGDRKGLGRFGVGATYASISQCKRTIFCSHPKGTGDFLATYIDLDKIAKKLKWTSLGRASPMYQRIWKKSVLITQVQLLFGNNAIVCRLMQMENQFKQVYS